MFALTILLSAFFPANGKLANSSPPIRRLGTLAFSRKIQRNIVIKLPAELSPEAANKACRKSLDSSAHLETVMLRAPILLAEIGPARAVQEADEEVEVQALHPQWEPLSNTKMPSTSFRNKITDATVRRMHLQTHRRRRQSPRHICEDPLEISRSFEFPRA